MVRQERKKLVWLLPGDRIRKPRRLGTPILVVLLGAVGLSAVTGYLDVVLIPALVFFVGLTVYAAYRSNRLLKGENGR